MLSSPANSAPADKPNSRRLPFRFSLRTLLLGITVLCIGLAWWVHRVKAQKAAVKGIQESGGWVYYDYERFNTEKKSDAHPESPVPAWLLTAFGVDFFHSVDVVSMVYKEDGNQRFDNP